MLFQESLQNTAVVTYNDSVYTVHKKKTFINDCNVLAHRKHLVSRDGKAKHCNK